MEEEQIVLRRGPTDGLLQHVPTHKTVEGEQRIYVYVCVSMNAKCAVYFRPVSLKVNIL